MTRRNWIAATVTVAWVVAVGAGIAAAIDYETTPGAHGATPASWPAASALAAPAGRPRIVMFVHPRCPCSRASLAELAALVREVGDRTAVTIAFIRPAGAGADWLDTDTVAAARGVRDAAVVIDDGGVEAARFGAETSGHVVAYDAAGRLGYAGGITRARGHRGDSTGRRELAALVLRGTAASTAYDVFGCALGGPQ